MTHRVTPPRLLYQTIKLREADGLINTKRDAQGKLVYTHTCFEGYVYNDREPVHKGTLCIPNTSTRFFYKACEAALARGETLFFHEERTAPAYPFFVELDFKSKLSPSGLAYVAAMVDAECRDPSFQRVFTEYHDMPLTPITLQWVDEATLQRLVDDKKVRRGNLGVYEPEPTLTWVDVIVQAANTTEYVVPDSRFVKVVSHLFAIACARVAQRCVATSYAATVEPSTFCVAALANQGADATAMDKHHRVSLGVHLHFAMLHVTSQTARALTRALRKAYEEAAKGHVPSLDDCGHGDFWNHFVDEAPHKRDSGGIRMPFSHKTVSCTKCPKAGHHCSTCGGARKLYARRYYGPVMMLTAEGTSYDRRKLVDNFICKPLVTFNTCSVRSSIEETKRCLLDTGSEAPVAVPRRTLQRTAQRMGISVDDEATLQQLGDHIGWYTEVQSTKGRGSQTPLQLLQGSPQRTAVDKHVPFILGMLFDSRFERALIRTATVEYRGHTTFPNHIVLTIKPTCGLDRLCYHRIHPHNHYLAGTHSQMGRTYFKIVLEHGTEGTVIVQLCNNTNRHGDARRTVTSCKEWSGEMRRMIIPHGKGSGDLKRDLIQLMNGIRDMAYPMHEQTDERCRELAQQTFKRYKSMGRAPNFLIGPTADYVAHINALL